MRRRIFTALAAILALTPGVSMAGDFMELQELSVRFMKFAPNGKDPLITSNGIPGRSLGEALNLQMNVDLFWGVGYWNNNVHSMTDSGVGRPGQFRTVGWEFELGAHVLPSVDVFYYHHSQHLLDTTYKYDGYPLQDAVGVRIKLFDGRRNKQ